MVQAMAVNVYIVRFGELPFPRGGAAINFFISHPFHPVFDEANCQYRRLNEQNGVEPL